MKKNAEKQLLYLNTFRRAIFIYRNIVSCNLSPPFALTLPPVQILFIRSSNIRDFLRKTKHLPLLFCQKQLKDQV